MADYAEDPVGDVCAFTPINIVKEESTIVEPKMASIKTEIKDEDVEGTAIASSATVTPKKRGRKPQNGTPATPASGTPSKRAKGTPGKSIPLPTSFETAGPEDRMLFHMREVEGRTYPEICTALETLTGSKPSHNTLKNRFNRLKDNFVVFEPDHVPMLLQKKKEVEEKFETEKWVKISEVMEAECSKKYPPGALQKKFKEVTKKTSATIIKDEE